MDSAVDEHEEFHTIPTSIIHTPAPPITGYLAINKRPLHSCEGMLGNQDKTMGKSKVCMGTQSLLILPN